MQFRRESYYQPCSGLSTDLLRKGRCIPMPKGLIVTHIYEELIMSTKICIAAYNWASLAPKRGKFG